jgi:hypothetical protein
MQRALCEDPVLIKSWFELVEQTMAKYGICDENAYNFDEASFMMGKITAQLVVPALERRGKPRAVQSGNREWVTLIAAINAGGWPVSLSSLVQRSKNTTRLGDHSQRLRLEEQLARS